MEGMRPFLAENATEMQISGARSRTSSVGIAMKTGIKDNIHSPQRNQIVLHAMALQVSGRCFSTVMLTVLSRSRENTQRCVARSVTDLTGAKINSGAANGTALIATPDRMEMNLLESLTIICAISAIPWPVSKALLFPFNGTCQRVFRLPGCILMLHALNAIIRQIARHRTLFPKS